MRARGRDLDKLIALLCNGTAFNFVMPVACLNRACLVSACLLARKNVCVQMKECAESETWHDGDSWQVCIRSSKEEAFQPQLSYFFDSKDDATRVCDELKRVCTSYEKRALDHDQLERPKIAETVPGSSHGMLATSIDEVRRHAIDFTHVRPFYFTCLCRARVLHTVYLSHLVLVWCQISGASSQR